MPSVERIEIQFAKVCAVAVCQGYWMSSGHLGVHKIKELRMRYILWVAGVEEARDVTNTGRYLGHLGFY